MKGKDKLVHSCDACGELSFLKAGITTHGIQSHLLISFHSQNRNVYECLICQRYLRINNITFPNGKYKFDTKLSFSEHYFMNHTRKQKLELS